METPVLIQFLLSLLAVLAALFIFVVGVGALALLVVYALDVSQTRHAIRRNYPIFGRLRYLFEHLGVFFRQYFFAQDREEMPFNRAQRSWVYRAAKNIDTTQPFGSTRDLRPSGTVLFANAPYPRLDAAPVAAAALTIGVDCPQPYTPSSLFNISAMSFGAISRPAVLALSNGARKAGCWLNTGEGGLSPYHLQGGADIVFQIGTAKYGVCDAQGGLDAAKLAKVAAIPQVRMFEIKLSQGAKPGKGGILPAAKVTAEIAAIRGIPVGRASLSPNRHLEIGDNAALLDFVHRVRAITGKPVGVKFVLGDPAWIDGLCAEIVRRGLGSAPDILTVDSADGGTGAAPMSLMDYVGLPVQESLPHVVDALTRHGLRERIRVIASGKLITPADVAWALCVGADFVNSARGFMFALGCIQSMRCNTNRCAAGITTHDPHLQRALDPADKAERVRHYVANVVREVGVIAHACGVDDPRSLTRAHCRVVTGPGRSAALAELHPPASDASLAATTAGLRAHAPRPRGPCLGLGGLAAGAGLPQSPSPAALCIDTPRVAGAARPARTHAQVMRTGEAVEAGMSSGRGGSRILDGRKRSASSRRWLERQLKDPYVAEARRRGYRSRAAFKLIELDDRFRLLRPGSRVIDLGAAPGGWTQVAVERTRAGTPGGGRVVACDVAEMAPVAGAAIVQADFLAEDAPLLLRDALLGLADVVLSDMAPPSSGHAGADHLRIIGLAEAAFDFAVAVLAPGGAFACKVWQGGTEGRLLAAVKQHFRTVRHAKPPASRTGSAELYMVATGFRAMPE